jgi:hypothetical protein
MRVARGLGFLWLWTGCAPPVPPDATPETFFAIDRAPPKEIRLRLVDSTKVSLVYPRLADSMIYGYVRIGPYRVVGLDSFQFGRIQCIEVPGFTLKDGLRVLAALAGAGLATAGQASGDANLKRSGLSLVDAGSAALGSEVPCWRFASKGIEPTKPPPPAIQ